MCICGYECPADLFFQFAGYFPLLMRSFLYIPFCVIQLLPMSSRNRDCRLFLTKPLLIHRPFDSDWQNTIWALARSCTCLFQKCFIVVWFLFSKHCVKKVSICSFSGLYFPAFWLYMGRYMGRNFASLRIHSECEKIRNRKTPNTDNFRAVKITRIKLFHTSGLFLYPLRTSQNQMFSDVFRVYRKKPIAWYGLYTWSSV